MTSTKPQQKSLGSYQSLYNEAMVQRDHQTALKYLLTYTTQYPEQDQHWNHEIISCLLSLKLYKQCTTRILDQQKKTQKGDYITNLNNLETLVSCAISQFNLEKANEYIKLMDLNFSKYSSQSSEKETIEIIGRKISDLKQKNDTFQIISEETRKNEAMQFKKLEDSDSNAQTFKEANQEVYLIPTQWMNKWRDYSFYKEMYQQSDNMEDEDENKQSFDQIYPGAIDASSLVETYVKNHLLDSNEARFVENYVLKKDKVEKHDFEIVSKDIADFLYQIYGGFRVKRFTILNPVTNEINVELFFKRINFIPLPTISAVQDKDTIFTIYISKFANLEQLNSKIKRVLSNVSQVNMSIWNKQYFRFLRISANLQKNYSSIFTVCAKNYKDPEIKLDVKEILIAQDESLEDMQVTENDIVIYELSSTDKFKIVPTPLIRKQSSKIESDSTNDFTSQQSTDQNTTVSDMQEEIEEEETQPSGKIRIRKIDENHVRNMMQKFRIQGNQKGFSGKKGLTGLQNLGNTCFMNSSLQCLSNVEELTTFMVNNEYVNDLNPDNPLGASGHLAVSYADLVRDMWQGNDSYVSPHYLKKVIGKFAPQFYGYSQQDSQELLSYLLDGLQEDLNRVKKKPIVETIDYCGGKDQEMSLEFYKNYKKRNDSVISDLMVGQFKSTLVCPDKHCGKVSITFDPFLTLSVPIPRVTKEDVQFYLIYKDPRKIPLKIETQVRSDSSISDLKQVINDNLNIPPQCLVFVNNHQSLIEEFLDDSERAVHMKEISGIAFAYEVDKHAITIKNILQQGSAMEVEEQETTQNKSEKPALNNQDSNDNEKLEDEEEQKSTSTQQKQNDNEPNVYIEVEMQQMLQGCKLTNTNIENSNIHNISYSRLLSLKASQTVQDLYLQIYRIMRVYFNIYKQTQSKPEFKVELDILQDSREQLLKEVQEFETNPEQKKLFRIFNKDMTPINYDSQEPILSLRYKNKNRLFAKIVIDEGFEIKCLRTKRCESFNFESQKTSKELSQNNCNLYDCIDQFVKKEQLEKGNEWYCNKCKKHVLATKQMEIYQTPKILIIHLKRFKSGNVRNYGRYYFESGGKKINDLIDFPIQNLSMNKYVLGANGKPQIYDLFAVSQHYGGMGGGHYTACAQNFINKRWYNFNDSSVSQSSPEQAVCGAAYVLFYRRRDQ